METARIAFAPKLAFRWRAVEIDHAPVECALVGGIRAANGVIDRAIHIFHRFQHALSQIARLIAIAQLERFVLACGCARRHGGASDYAAIEFSRLLP